MTTTQKPAAKASKTNAPKAAATVAKPAEKPAKTQPAEIKTKEKSTKSAPPELKTSPKQKPAKSAQPETKAHSEDKTAKAAKPKKQNGSKVIRDSFTFPADDYQKISMLKKNCLGLGIHVKKSEILRAGLNLLIKLDQGALATAIGQVEKIKTGRPVGSEKKS